jgi:hypothetical protein
LKASEIIIHQKIENEYALIELRSDGIVEVFFKDHFTMDIPAQEYLLKEYQKICNGKKMPFIYHAGNFVTITKEARENAIHLEEQHPANATAILATTLAYKLIAVFYLKFNKPKLPYKVFTDRLKAEKWLYQFVLN